MDSALIECASDLSSTVFKERSLYMITPKGLHILERFITKNGITAAHTLRLFAQQPICLTLLHLERRRADDDIYITKSVVEVLWRRFIGRDPNVSRLTDEELLAQKHARWFAKSNIPPEKQADRSIGIIVRKVSVGTEKKPAEEYQFPAWSAIEWLCEFTTCVCPEEAADLAAQFVRYGYIALVSDKGRFGQGNLLRTVKVGGAGGGAGAVMVSHRKGSV